MNKRLWKLLQLNVIYTNGKVTSNKKGRTQSMNSAFYTMLASYPIVFGLALFAGFITYWQWKAVPEVFFYQTGNMLLMTFGLIMFYSFSTFFKSRDFEQYLYYPFTKSEVFYGKAFAIFFMFSPFLFLVGALGFSFGLATGGVVAAIVQFILSIALGFLSFLLTISFVFYIGTQRVLKKFSTIFMGVGMVLFLVTMIIFSGTLGSSIENSSEVLFQSKIAQMPILSTYYQVIQTQPLTLLILVVLVGVLCICFFNLLKHRAMHKYLQNVFSDTNVKKNVKISYTKKSPQTALRRHNINIITANKQYVLMFIYLQIVPIVALVLPALGLSSVLQEPLQSLHGMALVMLCGIGFVGMSFMYTISENLYSLERENLDYMLSLPLTRRRIFQSKQRLALTVTTLPLVFYVAVVGIALHMHILNFIALFISVIVFNYIYQVYYLLRDEKSPNVNWSSEMDLLQGGMQTFLRVVRFYGLIILFAVMAVVFFFTTSFWWMEVICIIVFYGILLYLLQRYKRNRHL